MTHPSEFGLLELATPYALDAISDDERAEIERRLSSAPNAVAQAFREEVRIVRETMAELSANTALEPPDDLRDRVLGAISAQQPPAQQPPQRRYPWRTTFLAAAAAVVVALAAVSGWLALRPPPATSTAEQVFAAPDVRTVSGNIGENGTATVVFSRERDAGVLVMNNVPPPAPGTVYQMWLLRGGEPESAGTMDAQAVSPSTTAVLANLDNATALAFTVEPGSGSTRPTSQPIAELPLI